MKTIRICDVTLATDSGEGKAGFTFREKIEVAKLLDRLAVSVIDLGTVTAAPADSLLVKSVASQVKESTVAVCPGLDDAVIPAIWEALREATHPRLQVRAAMSTARMEYVYHKKADGMRQAAVQAITACRALCEDVEFIAEDATRADTDYLCAMLADAITAGATTVTVCDTAGVMLPDEFGCFIGRLYAQVEQLPTVTLGVCCSDAYQMANASAVAAVKAGAGEIKAAAVAADTVSLEGIAKLLSAKADAMDVTCPVRITQIHKILQDIEKQCSKSADEKSPFDDGVRTYPEDMVFTAGDGIEDIVKGAAYLGYDLSDADKMLIWKAFCDVVQKKDSVSIGELEAIIAAEAMQVPATYTLENYSVTTGNAVDILAHVKLCRDGEHFDGLSLGDGPIDAAFLAIEQITGHHYELDDFQIKAVTEGREAMGQTVVKLRSGGKVYSGRGLSTDIIGSGVAAYVNALNKILYEEENA